MANSVNTQLLQGESLVLRCREIDEISHVVSGLIEEKLREVAKDKTKAGALAYTFKSRHKGHNGILEKVHRKRAEGVEKGDISLQTYEPDHLTDAWACRFVTLYQKHIPEIVKQILKAVDDFNQVERHHEPLKLKEFVIYTNRPEADPLSIVQELLAIFDQTGLSSVISRETIKRPPENKKSAYSSVHLVFHLPLIMNFPLRAASNEEGKFEVQVRDIFEEGWGEIQHDLIYSRRDAGTEGISEKEDTLWRPHLNALKTFVDGCSQHASIIRSTYEHTRLKHLPSIDISATSRREDKDDVARQVKRTAKAKLAGTIEVAYDLLIAAHEGEIDGNIATENYLAAASKFEEAIDGLGSLALERVPGRMDRSIEYFLKLELANCYVNGALESSGRLRVAPAQISKAEAYLSELKDTFLSDATIPFRISLLATALERDRASTERAIVVLDECIRRVPTDTFLGSHHWMSLNAGVQLGFFHWILSELSFNEGDMPRRESQLELAIARTSDVLKRWNAEPASARDSELHRLFAHKAVANILYFLARLTAMGDVRETEIRRYVKMFYSIEVPRYREYFKTRDCLMQALYAVGEHGEALKRAHETRAELLGLAEHRAGRHVAAAEIENYLLDYEKRNWDPALRVISGLAPREG